MRNQHWYKVYQSPASPLARLGVLLVAIGTLALSFMLGLVVLAVAMGLALIGALVLVVRRLLAGPSDAGPENGPIEVEYRVIHRERQTRDRD